MTMSFFTIGHSTRSIAEFADLLHASQVELVVDVRHMPRSRTNPQFNLEVLPDVLKSLQIGYVHLAALGGLRPRGLETSPNLLWQNTRFLTDFQQADTNKDGTVDKAEFQGGLQERPSAALYRAAQQAVAAHDLRFVPSSELSGGSCTRRGAPPSPEGEPGVC